MRDDHNAVVAGLTGGLLVWALAAGAAGPKISADHVPVQTAIVHISPPPGNPSESVDLRALKATEAPLAEADYECAGIIVAATGWIFTDGFETGNTRAWEQGQPPLFSAVRILDLEFIVRFAEGSSGDHLVHLKLLTPKGHHYQTMSVWTSSDSAYRKSLRRIAGYPRPEAVQLIRKNQTTSLPEITLSLPVGGTQIATNSIYGTWTAEVYIDEQSEVCASQQFVLAP
jgi:hypothetical protein